MPLITKRCMQRTIKEEMRNNQQARCRKEKYAFGVGIESLSTFVRRIIGSWIQVGGEVVPRWYHDRMHD